jgi:hypothetical protein
LGINLTEVMKDLYYKMFMKEIEQGEKKKFSHAYGLEKSYYPK